MVNLFFELIFGESKTGTQTDVAFVLTCCGFLTQTCANLWGSVGIMGNNTTTYELVHSGTFETNFFQINKFYKKPKYIRYLDLYDLWCTLTHLTRFKNSWKNCEKQLYIFLQIFVFFSKILKSSTSMEYDCNHADSNFPCNSICDWECIQLKRFGKLKGIGFKSPTAGIL